MPYRVRKAATGRGWILEVERGRVWRIKSHHATAERAESARRLLEGLERGWKRRGRR